MKEPVPLKDWALPRTLRKKLGHPIYSRHQRLGHIIE